MTKSKNGNPDIAADLVRFHYDPLGFVMYAFRWGQEDLKGLEPDQWQIEVLQDLGDSLKQKQFNGVDPVLPTQIAVASGHGIGKSALVAWIILWVMATRPKCRGIVTASIFAQLQTKTWAELKKWKERCIFGDMFDMSNSKGSLGIWHDSPKLKHNWRADGQTCKEDNSEAFAGLHAMDSTPFYIFDEASAVPEKIWEVAEGGLTDGEPIWIVFGNYTRNTGRFHECFTKFRHRWVTKQIDSRTCRFPNKQYIQRAIEDYGEDSDYVRTRIRGLPPRAASNQLIKSSDIYLAQRRNPEIYAFDANVLGVDIGRGGDDPTILQPRRGNDAVSRPRREIRTRDLMEVVREIQDFHRREKFDAIFIDATGIGAGVYDRCLQLGLPVWEINFGANAPDRQYFNYRAYIYGQLNEGLKRNLAIPKDDAELEEELVAQEFYYTQRSNQIILSPKDDIRKLLGRSPDKSDALALTYALHIEPDKNRKFDDVTAHSSEYDPLNNNF